MDTPIAPPGHGASPPPAATTTTTTTTTTWTVIMPLLAGIAVHLAVRPLHEIDRHAPALLAAAALAPAACLAALHLQQQPHPHLGLDAALVTATATAALSFACGLLGSVLAYRVFFHRLRRFPGPLGARLSRFYALRHAARSRQMHLVLERLHEEYGDFVRVGPREIAIFRPSAIASIYGPASKCGRSAAYDNPSPDPAKSSIVGTRDPIAHRRRKKAWERGLGFRALDVYEPRVQSKVDLFLSRLALHDGAPVNVTKLCVFLGFDVMGEIGFSKDFRLLESGRAHPAVDGVREQAVYIGILGLVPWLFISLVKFMDTLGKIGLKFSFQAFLDWCSDEVKAKRKAVEVEKQSGITKDPQDVISWLIKAEDEGDGSAPPGEGAFQEDSRVLVVAGSDTTSAALANALYFLTRYPEVYHKLQGLLDAEFPGGEADWSYARLKNVPYLEHIAYETLRLKPSVPSGLSRLTPPGGLQVDEVHIPGDTIVSVPAHTIQRDPRYWDQPREFVPERWGNNNSSNNGDEGGGGGLTPERAPFIAFTRGEFACPGKNLALMEMRMVISRVALRYRRLAFAVPEDVVRFDEGAMDTFTMSLPPLPLVLTRR